MILTNDNIGKFLNRKVGTDIYPVGKIISVNKNIITLQTVEAKLSKEFTPEIAVGGFLGHCSNQDEQKYDYEIVKDSYFEIVINKSMFKNGYYISDKPCKFYDYNF